MAEDGCKRRRKESGRTVTEVVFIDGGGRC